MKLKKLTHYLILFVLSTGFLSALYMVFIVFKPEAGIGPLWESAKDLPLEFFLKRRLYALEAWIIFGILSLYIAIKSGSSKN